MEQLLTATRIHDATVNANNERQEKWLSDNVGTRGSGRLLLRISPQGTQRFYFRPYRTSGIAPRVIAIGLYSRIVKEGYFTLNQARLKVLELRQGLCRDSPANSFQRRGPNASTSEPNPTTGDSIPLSKSNSKGSLLQMCQVYAQALEDSGKKSASNVKGYVDRLIGPSNIGHLDACELKTSQFTEFLRHVIAEHSGYAASKVRSILHAAYAHASRSHLDPTASHSLVNFNIEVNPISSIDALKQYQKARERYLRDTELKEFWKHIQLKKDASIGLRALRLCILLGGQRGEQLLSVSTSQVDLESKTILLIDPKGRRSVPRKHLLPLCPQAETEIRWLLDYAGLVTSTSLFPGSIRGTTCRQETISGLVRQIRCEMEAKKLISEPFAFIDLRRTIETKFASLGVSQDVRAQIQSHGLSGVQNKHYNKYNYMTEKVEVLTMWEQHLASLLK